MPGKRLGEFELAAAQDASEDAILLEETVFSMAGVLRCCIESLGDYFDKHEDDARVEIGTKVGCSTYPTDEQHGFTLIDHIGQAKWLASWIASKEDKG